MFEQLSLKEMEEQLHTDLEHGLTEEEAERRRREQGSNVLAQPKKEIGVRYVCRTVE